MEPEAYASLQKAARDHLWMHFTRMSAYDDHGRPGHRARRGTLRLGRPRSALPGRPGRVVRQPARPRPSRTGRGGRQAGRGAGLLPALVLRPPDRDPAGRADRHHDPGRPEPGLLHQRRRRGGRIGLEAGQELLQARRQAVEAQGDQPGGRLPRHHSGRVVDHRTAGAQGGVRTAGAVHLPGAEHELLPGARTVPDGAPGRSRGLRDVGRRPDRGRHRAGGAGHRGGSVPGAGAERRRLLPATARLLRPGPGDLRRLRRAAGQRRGDLRVRPAGSHVRRRALRLRARHDHLRQGL